MIAMFVRRMLLTMFLACLMVAALEHFNPNPPPLLVDIIPAQWTTQYQTCNAPRVPSFLTRNIPKRIV